jgi:hypothetical protein
VTVDILEVIMVKRYQANEKDLDKVLGYLRIHNPNIASPEIAVRIAEAMYIIAHESAAHGKTISIDEAIELAVKEVVDTKN